MSVRRNSFVLSLVVGAVLVGLTPTAGMSATGTSVAKPRNLKLVINGTTLTAAQSTQGADEYLKVRAGRLTVGASWTGNIAGSGYYILIADSSSATKRRCRVGTTCTVVASKGIRNAQEMNWSIQIIRSTTGVMAAQKVICLIGVA